MPFWLFLARVNGHLLNSEVFISVFYIVSKDKIANTNDCILYFIKRITKNKVRLYLNSAVCVCVVQKRANKRP